MQSQSSVIVQGLFERQTEMYEMGAEAVQTG